MPTYEYRCPDGHAFEKFQRMSDPPEAECPECGREAERILSGGAGLLFKGEGFYITDYRSDSYRKAAEKEKGSSKSESRSESGSGSGSEGSSGSGSGGSGGSGGTSGSGGSGGSGTSSTGGSPGSSGKTGSKE